MSPHAHRPGLGLLHRTTTTTNRGAGFGEVPFEYEVTRRPGCVALVASGVAKRYLGVVSKGLVVDLAASGDAYATEGSSQEGLELAPTAGEYEGGGKLGRVKSSALRRQTQPRR